jgi:hypothetical protein
MEPLETLAAGIKHVDALLDEDVLEPDLDRTDWARMKARVGMVRDGLDNEVTGVLDAALADAEGEGVRDVVRKRVAALLADAAALVHASGDEMGANKLRAHAKELTPDGDAQAELRAGDVEPLVWVRLHHARWLLFHRRRADADRVAKGVIRDTKQAALRDAAKKVLRAPRPITSAPPLFRLNGCGVGLYGSRDETPDGWYVATYCIAILFIPVFPLTAYRVRHAGGNSYQFLAKEPLGPIARAWQLAVAAAAAIGIGWSGVASWLDSPDHKAKVAIEAAQAAEAKGDRGDALEKYAAVVRDYDGLTGAAAPAVEAVLRLSAANVPDPCTAASVDKVGRVVDEWGQMPAGARATAAGPLVQRLEGWATQIGDGSVEQVDAALEVLDMAAKVAESGGDRAEIDARRGRLRRTMAQKVEATRPLQALALYVAPPADAESLAAAGRIIDGFGDAPSLWIEAEHDVGAWADEADKRVDLRQAAGRVRERLRVAREGAFADQPLIEAGDEKKLAAALARTPGDQEVAGAIAQIRRRHGDLKGALATLGALGPPGRMTAAAQQLLADCHVDAGDLAKAETILSGLVAERLPAFQIAQRELMSAVESTQQRLIAQAKAGNVDEAEMRRIGSAPESEQGAMFREWLNKQLDADPKLSALRSEYVRRVQVVPAALSLGLIELRRANAAASAEDRKALYAAAEKVFLSIRNEAEGNPGFHLALGQVYHRLGRAPDGDKELEHLLDRKDPQLTLGVAHVYRDLGLPVRAQQITLSFWTSATDKAWKDRAAELMSHLVNEIASNEDDEEMWLKRSDQSSPEVKRRLLGIEARRLRRQGKLAEADRAFQRICDELDRDAGHDAAAANNAAVAYLERYSTFGDPAHLRAAVKQFEAARRLSPQDAIVTHNLADALGYQATVTVLDRWIKTKSLALEEGDASVVLGAMLSGPLRDEVLAALRKDPSFHRSLDLSQEEQALAPQRATGYERQIRWLRWTDDDKALVDLQKRLESMPPFDASAKAEARRANKEKTKDALYKSIAAQSIARAKETVDRAEHAGHAPTIAAAQMVLGVQLASLAYLDPTPENLDATVDAARKAAQAWPEGGMDDSLPNFLAWAGLVRAGADSGAVRKVLEEDGRVYGTTLLLRRAITAPDGEGALVALRRRPEIVEAAKLRKAKMGKRPGLFDVMLARVTGDAEMEKDASAAFQREGLGAEIAIEAIMAPGQQMEKDELDFWKSGAKGK